MKSDKTKEYDQDLSEFLAKASSFSDLLKVQDFNFDPTVRMGAINEAIRDRTRLYIEMMGAAFLQETGFKASEVRLVISYGLDRVSYCFEKKEKENSGPKD